MAAPQTPGAGRHYHVCPGKQRDAILRDGLQPRIGPRAGDLGETVPAVYLFDSLEAVETAMSNWLGEAFEHEEELSLLEVGLPPDLRIGEGAGFETVVLDPVPADCIVLSVISPDDL